jgi:proteasome accessory factor C
MTESALDRTARALDLVPYLLEHQGISIPELADVFGVSEKQINDDLVLIHMCGLPGYTPLELIEMYYEDGYVTVSDPQSFDRPRKMNRTEMTSILVSLDLLKSLRTDDIGSEIESLKNKLLKNAKFDNPIVVVANPQNTKTYEFFEVAIAKAKSIRISYSSGSRDATTERDILPNELYVANGFTYINAWCYTSNGDRTFRLDRILNFEIIESQKVAVDRSQSSERIEAIGIELLVSKSARNFVEDNRAIIGTLEDGEFIRVSLNRIDREWLIRTIIGFGGLIQVSRPMELAAEVRNRAQVIRSCYKA